MSPRLRRNLLGGIALAFLAGAGYLLLNYQEGTTQYALGSMAWRISLTLGVLWLALPQVLTLAPRIPVRLLTIISLAVLLFAVRPKSFPLVIMIILAGLGLEVVGWLFRPLPDRRKRR